MPRACTPTLASQVLRPFLRLLRTLQPPLSDLHARAGKLEASSERIELPAALAFMDELAVRANMPDIGLRAALFTEIGDFQVLEWVATSAATWRDANLTVCRYAHVLNEAADYRLQVHGDRAHLMLGSSVPLGPIAADYQVAAYHLAIQLRVHQPPPGFEVWFRHAAPADPSSYRAIFSQARLVFDAPFDGFVSDAAHLSEPLPTANLPLHGVLREHADHLLSQRADGGDDLIARVDAHIAATLSGGKASAEHAAASFGMTRRTLTRQLAQRGTSYSELLTQARYRLALHYLLHSDRSIEDIAFLLGFSECSPFVRAFKRWSGYPPLEYRRQER